MFSRGHWCLTFSSQSSWGKNWQTQPYIFLPHVIDCKCVNFASIQVQVLKSAIENPYYIDMLKHKHDVKARAEMDKNMLSNRFYLIQECLTQYDLLPSELHVRLSNAWGWLLLLNTGARSAVLEYSDIKAGFKGLWWQFQAHKVVIQGVIHHWGIIFKKQHSCIVALNCWLLQGSFIHINVLMGKNNHPPQ